MKFLKFLPIFLAASFLSFSLNSGSGDSFVGGLAGGMVGGVISGALSRGSTKERVVREVEVNKSKEAKEIAKKAHEEALALRREEALRREMELRRQLELAKKLAARKESGVNSNILILIIVLLSIAVVALFLLVLKKW